MLSIRRLQRIDGFGDLVELSKAFFEEYEGHHEELFRIQALDDQEIVEYFSRFLEQDDRAAFIALRDGKVVGYITVCVQPQPGYWKVRRIGHISGLMVRKPDRREGIGSSLLDQAKAYFTEQQVKYYTVYTAVGNSGAIGFYKSRGMEPLHSHLVGTV
jgi:ribosomal protein S18 acetylase RimI-like enzyme